MTAVACPPPASVPVARSGWTSALTDCGLASLGESLQGALMTIDSASNAATLQEAARTLVSIALGLARDLWCLAALEPAQEGEVARLRDCVLECARSAFAADTVDAQARLGEILLAIRSIEAIAGGEYEDPCAAAFGVPIGSARDVRGVLSRSRLLAAWHGRYDDLAERVANVLAPVTDEPPDLLNATKAAGFLVLTSRHCFHCARPLMLCRFCQSTSARTPSTSRYRYAS
jgi:hypothetical protein